MSDSAPIDAEMDLELQTSRMVQRVQDALGAVRGVIAAEGVAVEAVRIVAVTKGFGPCAPLAAARCGLLDVGENFAGELIGKATACADHCADLRWHFLGALQTNKIGRLASFVHTWHSVDSARRCTALATHTPGARAFIQVNVTGSASRGGCEPATAVALAQFARVRGLDVRGFMAVGPDPAAVGIAGSEAAFGLLGELRVAAGVEELSAGMSDDYRAALRMGARTLRLGSVLFGDRSTIGRAGEL